MPELKIHVSKETYELGQGLIGFAVALKESLEDGFQIGDDLPEIVQASLEHLVPALEGAGQIDDEAKDDLAQFLKTWAIVGADLYAAIKGE